LFGKPTDLPWALEVDPIFRGGLVANTFHPTFLYEALWNLALAGGLVLLERRRQLLPGELFNLYVLGYAVGRLWVEELRIDPASLVLGVRVNLWVSGLTIVSALAVLIWRRRRARRDGEVGALSQADA
ncbi:MAG: prolipoprotein diacylglyceryl transferase family protein, partial [Acidimicrobiales bacterium]